MTPDRNRAPRARPSEWRWKIASLVNRLPGACWSQLVDWIYAVDWPEDEREGKELRHWRQSETCRADAERCGTCYCGKLRRSA